TDVEWRADFFTCLLGDAADFDHDGTGVDLESVDVVGGGAATDLVEPFDDKGAISEVGQPSSGEQAPSPCANHDSVELRCAHEFFLSAFSRTAASRAMSAR